MSVTKINICGRIYGKDVELELFPLVADSKDKYCKWTTLYGDNGTGKSTLSHALYKYENQGVATGTNEDDVYVTNLGVLPENVYVYNDDFREGRLHFENSALGAIMMTSLQASKRTELKDAEASLDNAIKQNNSIQKDYDNEIKNFNDEEKSLISAFKGNGSWADTERKIKHLKRNSSITIKDIENFYTTGSRSGHLSKEKINALEKQLEEGVQNISNIEPTTEHIPKLDSPDREKTEKLINNAVLYCQQSISLSVTDSEISRNLQEPVVKIPESEDYLSKHPKFCKLCLQSLSEEHISEVLEEIQKLRRMDEVQQFSLKGGKINKKLEEVIDMLPSLNVAQKKNIKASDQLKFEQQMSNFKVFIEEIEKYVTLKKDSPTTAIKNDIVVNADDKCGNFFSAVSEINLLIDNFNSQIDEYNNNKLALSNLNRQVAIEKNRGFYNKWKDAKLLKEKAEENLQDSQKNVISAKAKYQRLQGEVNGRTTQLAMDKINRELSIIFLSDDRLRLEENPNESGTYKVISRGQPVQLSNLSTGEKSAISLAYFFSIPYENKAADFHFDQDSLFVLDDPISSVDRTNEIGLFSLLENELSDLIKNHVSKNCQLQVLAMTHSSQVFYTLQQIGGRIYGGKKQREFASKQLTLVSKVGDQRSVKPILKNRNEIDLSYRRLIKDVYNWTVSNDNQDTTDQCMIPGYLIGNMTRRILEEYGYFNFDKSGRQILSDQNILNYIKIASGLSESICDKIKSTKFHIWLNAESHGEDKANTGDKIHADSIGENEMLNETKLILIFLDAVHQTGLGSLISNKTKDIKRINQRIMRWKEELEGKEIS